MIVPCVINSELVKKNAGAYDPWGLEYTKQNTAGGGAYRVAKWTPGTELVFERNESWKNGPLPAVRRIVWRMVPSAGNRARSSSAAMPTSPTICRTRILPSSSRTRSSPSCRRRTRKLMRATPRPGVGLRDLLIEPPPAVACAGVAPGEPLLAVENLVKEYPRGGATRTLARLFRRDEKAGDAPFRAVDGLSFTVRRCESVGLVGESGCGKSTTSMMVMRLIDPTSGTIDLAGEDIGSIPARSFARLPSRKRIQMDFQDPTDSLNPRFTAARAIADPIRRLGPIMGRDAIPRPLECQIAMQLPLGRQLRRPRRTDYGRRLWVEAAKRVRSAALT